jgi:hypothetical protein
MYKITGKTYEAREALKKAGYTFDSKTKSWIGSSREAFDALVAKWTSGGWGVATATMARGLHIEEFSIVTCEI